MFGGIELGGTKCILAVAESPSNIVSKKIINTSYPENTFSEILDDELSIAEQILFNPKFSNLFS